MNYTLEQIIQQFQNKLYEVIGTASSPADLGALQQQLDRLSTLLQASATIIGDFVPPTRTVNGKALDADIILSASDVGALPASTPLDFVPASTTINGQPLTGDIVIDGGGVVGDCVPTSRTVNSKPLNADIILNASDVGALPSTTEFVPPTRTINGQPLSDDVVIDIPGVTSLSFGQLALGNGWVNYGAPYPNVASAKSASGIVFVRGAIKSGTIGAVAFTLPVGSRPAFDSIHAVYTSASTIGYIRVFVDGSVEVIAGNAAFVYLDISFVAA
jgi:hypothetical protein